MNSLFIELVRSGIDIPINKLEILVRSHLIEQYNPIWEYFDNLEYWDNENHIGKLCSYVKTTDDKSFQKYFEKMADQKCNLCIEAWLHQQTVFCSVQY